MNTTLQEVLYWSGTMLDNAPNLDSQLKATGSSGFNNILLWSLHVNQANPKKNIALGDLTWNDTLLVSSQTGKAVFDPTKSFTKLAGRLRTLAGKKIFFSIGAGGTSDFTTIKQLYSTPQGQTTLQNNLGALLQNLAMVTGFDFDVEDCFDVPSTAWLTEILATKFNVAVTYCPYFNQGWWEQCLESVYQNLKKQPVIWFNLQCYSGGTGQDPISWANAIKQNQKKNGVANASTFIVPGYAANNKAGDGPGICPSQFTTTLAPYKGKVGGAFVWNSQHIFGDPAPCNGSTATINDYANAIAKGL
ncbi:MAG TPA: hypothetical protein VGW57_10790 [Chthoniobacterales bacterium]|nr:hypothetical protein [Chthoniobacterales bacterium]